jgi:hypothetical protein
MRLVTVNLTGVDTAIIAPPALDAQGRPFVLVLPIKTNPTPAERSYNILVETASAVTNVLISFLPSNAPFSGGAAVLDATFQGDRKRWAFSWTNLVDGQFTIRAEALAAGVDSATRIVQVALRPQDSDGDGLPDDWERQHLLNELSATGDDGANGDPDQDHFTNLEEFLAGSDPKDANSLLRIVNLAPGGRQITWTSVPGKAYQVFASTNAESPFVVLKTNVPATGATTSFFDPAPLGSRKFYRVNVTP